MYYETRGDSEKPVTVWAHGWGQSLNDWAQLCAGPLADMGHHVLVDFPGFGQSGRPSADWGTAEYADFMAAFLKDITDGPVLWVGHSFGCRVGLQMAIRHPHLIKSLCLIGGAGLRRKRTLWENMVLYTKIYTFKACKIFALLRIINEDWVKSKFGSPDYKRAHPDFRPVMVRVNSEDLTDDVPAITCPVKLIYGTADRETPPEIGQRLEKLIPNASLLLLEGQDHYTPLTSGRYQVVKALSEFFSHRHTGECRDLVP